MLVKDFLSEEKLSGSYMLVGDDAYLKTKVIEGARARLPEGIVEFNLNVIKGGKNAIGEALSALNILPAFSDIRIVYVELSDKPTKDDLASLKTYLENPLDSSVLILDDVNRYAGTLRNLFTVVDTESYLGAESVDFVKRRAGELGGSINHAGAKLLSDYCNNDMMRIDRELSKLIEYKEGAMIGEMDVAECVHADIDYEIYEIAGAVGEKNLSKALDVIGTLMAGGFKPSDVLGQLSRAFRRMLYIKLSPLGDEELGTILEIKPFAVKKTRSRLSNFTPLKLKKIYDNLNDMEFKFKSGVMSDSSALDNALVTIFA